MTKWCKSSLSFINGDCVEVASLRGGEFGVRDSKAAEGLVLCFTPEEWAAFLPGAKMGEFDSYEALRSGVERVTYG